MQNDLIARIKKEESERYTGFEPLGSGISRQVFKAWDMLRESFVAIKIPHTDRNIDLDMIFRNDIQKLDRIRQGKNIVPSSFLAFQHRITALLEVKLLDNFMYTVEEFCGGQNLKDYVATRVCSDWDTFRIIIQIAEGMSYMHKIGLVHKDLKLENILCDTNNTWITDLGSCEFIGEKPMQRGSVLYLAPEEFDDVPNHPSADVYKVGILTYYCLTGSFPFESVIKIWEGLSCEKRNEQLNMVIDRIKEHILPKKRPLVGIFSPQYKYLLVKSLFESLQANPGKRPQDGYEFLQGLTRPLKRYGLIKTVAFAGFVAATILYSQPITKHIPSSRIVYVMEQNGLSKIVVSTLSGEHQSVIASSRDGKKDPQWFNGTLLYLKNEKLVQHKSDGSVSELIQSKTRQFIVSSKQKRIAWLSYNRDIFHTTLVNGKLGTPVLLNNNILQLYRFSNEGNFIVYKKSEYIFMQNIYNPMHPLKISYHDGAHNPAMTKNHYFYVIPEGLVCIKKSDLQNALNTAATTAPKYRVLTVDIHSQLFPINNMLYAAAKINGNLDLISVNPETLSITHISAANTPENEKLSFTCKDRQEHYLYFIRNNNLYAYALDSKTIERKIKSIGKDISFSDGEVSYFKPVK